MTNDIREAAKQIKAICEASDNRSQYFRYGGEGYKSAVRHFLETSADVAYAAVQPGSADDLQKILAVLGKTKAPFAVKGGGHNSNPGFSSTKGIQIHMARFNKVEADKASKTLRVGAGCLFDEVYYELDSMDWGPGEQKRNIVGGATSGGVGVAGWLLGGGYSLKTNQFGLGIDNLRSVKVVLPIGLQAEVSAKDDPEVFRAIKGGGNNFGIIYEFEFETHPQSEKIRGDVLAFREDEVPLVKKAILNFVNYSEDPKAAIIAAFRYFNRPNRRDKPEFQLTVQYFYDDAGPLPETIQEFLRIKGCTPIISGPNSNDKISYFDFDFALSRLYESVALQADFFTAGKSGTFSSKIDTRQPMEGAGENARGRWGCVMVAKYTKDILNEAQRQAKEASQYMIDHSGKFVLTDCWPFMEKMFANSEGKPAAWPHKNGQPNAPLIVYFLWEGEKNDSFWISAMKTALDAIQKKVDSSGYHQAVYTNTAFKDTTTFEDVYDDERDNIPFLRFMRSKLDPLNVMSQTGGFRIPAK